MKNRFRRLLSAVMAIIMTAFLLPVQAGEDSSMRQHASGTETENVTMLGFRQYSAPEQQVYSFNPAAPDEAQLLGGLGETTYGQARTTAAEYIGGTLYFYDMSGLYFSAPVDSPWEKTQLGYIDIDDYWFHDMDFDYSTSTLYALAEDYYGNWTLLTIDKDTGNYIDEYILSHQDICKIGITTDGSIYAMGSGKLYSIVISNSATVENEIGPVGITNPQAMAYDHNGGAMYASFYSSTELYRIDLETGEAESVGDMGFTLEEMVSIYENTETEDVTMLGFREYSDPEQQVYSFIPASPDEAQLLGGLGETTYGHASTKAAEYIDGTLYFYDNTGLYFSAPVDSPWEKTQLGYIDIDEYWFYDLDFDYSTNTLYALAEDYYAYLTLLTIDKDTGNYIDEYRLSHQNIRKIGITTDGSIYALSDNGLLYNIVISNGATVEKEIGYAGICPSARSAMVYDHNGGAMYAASSTELYRIDLDTAEAESVGDFGFCVWEMVSIYENSDGTSIPAESVELDIYTLSLGLGQSDTINACVLPVNATNRSVVWTSDNEEVAAVDANGVVTGVSLGTATITATTVSGGHTASCVVEVSTLGDLGEALNVGGCTNMYNTGHDIPWTVSTIFDDIGAHTSLIGVADSYMTTRVTLNAGDVINFWHYVELDEGTEASLSLYINDRFIKLFTNESFFAEVHDYNGTWAYYQTTVEYSGEYTITWVLSSACFVQEDSCNAYIKDVYIGAPVPVEGVNMTESVELSEDSYFRLEWEVYPAYAANRDVIFSSTDESVVTVGPQGRIHAVGAGTADVILTTVDGGHIAICTVTVTPSDYTRLYGIDMANHSLITFTDSAPGQTEVLFSGFVESSAALYYDGIVYGIALVDEYFEGFSNPHMWTYNIETEEYNYGGTFCSTDYSPRHLAYDYKNSKMYVLGFDAFNQAIVYEVDPVAGTVIEGTEKAISSGILPTCFTIALDGTAYIIDTTGILYSFDISSDVIELTAIGNTGVSTMNGQAYSQGLCFDYQNGTLYFSYVAGQSDFGLCTVNVNTGEAERLGRFSTDVFQVCGLFAIYDVPEHVLGDANGDGNVDMADALQIMRHSMGISTIPDEYLGYVDMNNDGVVNSADALIVARMCMAAMQ